MLIVMLPHMLYPIRPVLLLADEAAEGMARDTVAAVLILAGIVLIAVLMANRAKQRFAARANERPSAREQISELKAAARKRGGSVSGGEADAGSGEARDVETAQRFASLLDTKAERLEHLLLEAEERIADLERALARVKAEGPPTRHEMTDHVANQDGGGDPDGGDRAGNPAHESGRTDARDGVKPAQDELADPLTRAVYELADDGRTPVEIARELDEQTGKVELILALRQSS